MIVLTHSPVLAKHGSRASEKRVRSAPISAAAGAERRVDEGGVLAGRFAVGLTTQRLLVAHIAARPELAVRLAIANANMSARQIGRIKRADTNMSRPKYAIC
jgi:hypothetical protein